MKGRIYFVFAFFLLILFSINASADTAQGTETRITNYGSGKYFPAIYGDRIVWSDTRNGSWDLYMYDLSTFQETHINTSGSAQVPAIYGDRIVWCTARDNDIYMYNLSTCTETQITTSGLASSPAIYEDRIVWRDFGSGYNIFMYNLSTSIGTSIATSEPSSSPAIYGDRIVWANELNDDSNIYLYNLSTSTQTKITTNESYLYSPIIYKDRIVYEAYRNGNSDIYMYDLSTKQETRITTNGLQQLVSPAIYEDRIVWQDDRNRNSNIYMYNISTHKETQITTTTNESYQYDPAIYENRIVWLGFSDGSHDIYMFTLSEKTLPVANFTSNVTEGYAALSVQFIDLSENATEWKWDFGDGSTSTEQNPVHIYPVAGNYTVNLASSNQNGTDSKLSKITVFENPLLPVANFSTNVTSGCVPLTVKFIDLSRYEIERKWDFGDGNTSTQQNPTHIYSKTGTFTVKLTAFNGNNTNSKSATINVLQPSVYAYITNPDSNNVSVIDTETNNIVATISVGSLPYGVAVNPNGTRVYVANCMSDTVSVINTATNTVIATVNVEREPWGVSVTPDGKKVYVSNFISNTVSVIDTVTNNVTATVNVGYEPEGVAVTPDGTKLYVANSFSNTVSVINTNTNTIIATVPVGAYPYGVAVNPAGTEVYISNVDSDDVSVIDTATDTVIATVNVRRGGWDAISGIAVNPSGTKVYVGKYNSNKVSIIDTATKAVIADVNVGINPIGVAITPDGKKVYVANWGSRNISVIDTATNDVTSINLENRPYSLGQFIGPLLVQPIIPVADFSMNVTSGYAPLAVQFKDLSQDSTGRIWDFNNDSKSDSCDEAPVYLFTIPGIYDVNLFAINENGTAAKTATITVLNKDPTNSSSGENSDEGSKSGGGSSRGGSVGGGSPEPAKNVEVKELSQVFIINGKPIKFDFTKNATCVVYVGFDSKKTVGKTTTIVEQLKGKSALVSALPDGEVYKSFNVWVGNSGYATSKNIEEPLICFKVEKTWLQNKNVEQKSITLNRYEDEDKHDDRDNTWTQLPANLTGEDNRYLYFTAEVPNYGSFAIAGEIGAPSSPSTETTATNKGNDSYDSEIAAVTEESAENTESPGFGIINGVVCLFCMFLYRIKN